MGGICSSFFQGAAGVDTNLFATSRSPLRLTDEIFDKYDTSKDGQLQLKELGPLINDAFPGSELCAKDLKILMDALDLDHDGSVGRSELRAFLRCYNPTNHKVKAKTALVIIDVQNDFITGTLANPYQAADIVPIINGMRDKFDVVVISRDWHPQEHCSFVESVNAGHVKIAEKGKQFQPLEMATLAGDADRAEHKQVLFPRHAVQDTEGSRCHADLVLRGSDKEVFKGTRPNIDSFSAFFDNCKANDTGLTAVLDAEHVTHVYCVGLVLDFCVKASAVDGAAMGFKAAVVEDACRPFVMDQVGPTKEELAKAGVAVLSSEEALREASASREYTLPEWLATIKEAKLVHEIRSKLVQDLPSHPGRAA